MKDVVDSIYQVYKTFGRFVYEIIYKKALCRELELRGYEVKVEHWFDFDYKGTKIERAFRVDM